MPVDPTIIALIIQGITGGLGAIMNQGQKRQSFDFPGSQVKPQALLTEGTGRVRGMEDMMMNLLGQGVSLPDANVQQPGAYAGGGLPFPIGLTGSDKSKTAGAADFNLRNPFASRVDETGYPPRHPDDPTGPGPNSPDTSGPYNDFPHTGGLPDPTVDPAPAPDDSNLNLPELPGSREGVFSGYGLRKPVGHDLAAADDPSRVRAAFKLLGAA